MTNRELFIEFAKNSWFKSWVINAKNKGKTIKIFIDKVEPQEWINQAFLWEDTPEGHHFWAEVDEFWRKELKNILFQEDKSFNIGVEWEFWTTKMPRDVFYRHNLETEWYTGMFEANNFLAKKLKTEDDIFNFFTEVLQKMKKIQAEIKEAGGKMNISTRGTKIDAKSVAFNGLHIHISLNHYYNATKDFYRVARHSNYVEWFKLKELPTYRAIVSHHIWGSRRRYEYSYKRKRRYAPIILTQIPTVEFRIFDVEDIIYKTRRRKLAKFLYELISMFENEKEIPYKRLPRVENGESLLEIYNLCDKFLSKKPSISSKIVEKTDDYMKIIQNYQIIELCNVGSDDEHIKLSD